MAVLTLRTTDSQLLDRNATPVEVIGHITEPNDEYDAEVLPMVKVRFEDGFETAVWSDELVERAA